MDGQYINRLIDCGFSPREAFLKYYLFITKYHFTTKELEDYLSSLERRGATLCM